MKGIILISGGSGLIGTHLTTLLQQNDYEVRWLSHSGKQGPESVRSFQWDVETGTIEEGAFEGVDYIIHLAGAGIMDKKWTDQRKQEIIDSRVKSARLLHKYVKDRKVPLKAFVSASGISYYPVVTSKTVWHEADPPGDQFPCICCIRWEAAADEFGDVCRVVKLRTGMVLAKEDGILPQMARPVKFFAGAPLGSGKQMLPWIHIDDHCSLYLKAIEDNQMEGTYNAVANNATNEEFTRAIGKAVHRPIWFFNVPSFVIRMMFGERSQLILYGSKVGNDKIKAAGYKIKHQYLDGALDNLL